MSVIGISPSDIVGGARIVNKAVGAFNTDTGAQAQYQAATQSSKDIQAAIKALSTACSSFSITSSDELRKTLDRLQKTHEQQEQRTLRYDAALGEGSSRKKRSGIQHKLRWTFQEDKDIRESNARNRLAVDAALLQTLQ
jgi:hypothetical protein